MRETREKQGEVREGGNKQEREGREVIRRRGL